MCVALILSQVQAVKVLRQFPQLRFQRVIANIIAVDMRPPETARGFKPVMTGNEHDAGRRSTLADTVAQQLADRLRPGKRYALSLNPAVERGKLIGLEADADLHAFSGRCRAAPFP